MGICVFIMGIFMLMPVIMAVVFLLFHFISVRTVYGRSVYAVGGNEESARLSGISVWRTRIVTFALLGFLAATQLPKSKFA